MDDLQTILTTDLTKLNDEQALQRIGDLIDLAARLGDENGLNVALSWCNAVHARSLDDTDRALLLYFEANAWSGMSGIREQQGSHSVQWLGPASECWEKEIVNLRRASNTPGFPKLASIQRCQILTNLGNRLSSLGRFSEAVECFDEALEIDARFGMALGNRGITLSHMLNALPHLPHEPGCCSTAAFHQAARRSLKEACLLPLEDGAAECFQFYAAHLDAVSHAPKDPFDPTKGNLGLGKAEQAYRRWSLSHRLFLNPLNDLGAISAGAADTLHLSPVTVQIGASPYFEGFFNQLKQEFVSARYLFYEGMTDRQPHFSDSGVTLYDTLDYPVYGLAGEKVKLALRSVYSLFDKLAFFLNYYLELGIPARQVSFRGFWYQSQKPDKGLKREIETRENWPLRGLFWMAKDLYDATPGFRDAMEPEAREIDITRNHAEHKYLKVHDDLWPEMSAGAEAAGKMPDDAAFSIGYGMLNQRTLRVMKLARSALVYLAYAVRVEEERKQHARGSDDRILTLPIRWMNDADKPGMEARLDQPNTESRA